MYVYIIFVPTYFFFLVNSFYLNPGVLLYFFPQFSPSSHWEGGQVSKQLSGAWLPAGLKHNNMRWSHCPSWKRRDLTMFSRPISLLPFLLSQFIHFLNLFMGNTGFLLIYYGAETQWLKLWSGTAPESSPGYLHRGVTTPAKWLNSQAEDINQYQKLFYVFHCFSKLLKNKTLQWGSTRPWALRISNNN